jgi:hypothetical protein
MAPCHAGGESVTPRAHLPAPMPAPAEPETRRLRSESIIGRRPGRPRWPAGWDSGSRGGPGRKSSSASGPGSGAGPGGEELEGPDRPGGARCGERRARRVTERPETSEPWRDDECLASLAAAAASESSPARPEVRLGVLPAEGGGRARARVAPPTDSDRRPPIRRPVAARFCRSPAG